jgi:hypothetical protein
LNVSAMISLGLLDTGGSVQYTHRLLAASLAWPALMPFAGA